MVLRKWRLPADSLWVFPPALALCFVLLAALAPESPSAAVLAAAAAGALYVFRSRGWACLALVGVSIWALRQSAIPVSSAFWSPVLFMAGAIFSPPQLLSFLIRVPSLVWSLCLIVVAACLYGAWTFLTVPAVLFEIPGCLCAAILGAGLTRHLAMADARILAWGENGLETLTRNLLLGRITSGMLHDLAQPLNVTSMANGNLGYIVEHLDIPPDKREQMVERIRRIATSTESAAAILSLFRWFGRDNSIDHDELSVRSALERAIAVTKSNVRHGGVAVELQGNALDHLLPVRHGAVEMMAVAALLSVFGNFILSDGDRTKIHGTVRLDAELTSAHVLITVHSMDDQGQPCGASRIDRATLWLIEQIAIANGSVFRYLSYRKQTACFSILIARDDI